ncbi:uncharacterized protein BDZ99DRAFT_181049 [Mytilinidion resinicola]|uniref:Zn(2)-C6 fungal-type domain-containing protein n=1 Tax=Mytilinidion resinicola TaxID=574789 RepID=A0A6A6Z0D2_9PEZI|nr:uncharacterized protein BDZ99DRAFT_181049 [Mytilinidion resinicola]KAF2814622.1 hypothetical protein BDZ99DRAFT_181049 [Mytilinidion resinicola]
MVYCGRPSKGCQPCRSRKTKCDGAIPACSQCLKASRECFGYRNEQSLIFRDETRKVVRKARGSSSTLSPSTPETSPSTLAIITPSRLIEDDAASFFFFHYVLKEPAFANGLYDFLPTLYSQGSSAVFQDIVTATGLAGLANLKRSPTLMHAARAKHSTALRTVNASLQNQQTATSDSTLMAVLLLGLFENITCSSPNSIHTWAKHVSGALTIARMRGRQQLEHDLGRRLYLHLRNQVLIDCMQRQEAIPDIITEWNASSLRSGHFEEANGLGFVEPRLFQIMAQLAALRHKIKVKGHSHATTAEAVSIDNDLITWAATVSSDYAYTTVSHSSSNFPFPYYHNYKFIWSATCWNIYRTARIFVSDKIIHWYSSSNSTVASQQILSGYIQNEAVLADEICESVPYYFGGDPECVDSLPTAPKAASGFALLWPLYAAATTYYPSKFRTGWIVKQYDVIGNMLGIRLASVFASTLRKNQHISVWDRDPADCIEDDEVW